MKKKLLNKIIYLRNSNENNALTNVIFEISNNLYYFLLEKLQNRGFDYIEGDIRRSSEKNIYFSVSKINTTFFHKQAEEYII